MLGDVIAEVFTSHLTCEDPAHEMKEFSHRLTGQNREFEALIARTSQTRSLRLKQDLSGPEPSKLPKQIHSAHVALDIRYPCPSRANAHKYHDLTIDLDHDESVNPAPNHAGLHRTPTLDHLHINECIGYLAAIDLISRLHMDLGNARLMIDARSPQVKGAHDCSSVAFRLESSIRMF